MTKLGEKSNGHSGTLAEKKHARTSNNQPAKPGKRYHVVAAHPSKNCETWFIFHWDFTKIDPLNKVNR